MEEPPGTPFGPSSPEGEHQPAPFPAPGVPAGPETGESAIRLHMPPSVPPEELPPLPPLPSGPPTKTRGGSHPVRNVIILIVLGSSVVGFLSRTLREASAAPQDKAACLTVLEALTAGGAGGSAAAMFNALDNAKDKTLREASGVMVSDLNRNDMHAFTKDLNKVIGRCRTLSGDFRSKFHEFCQSHEGSCTSKVDLNPF